VRLVGIASLPVEHRRAAAVTQRFEVEVEGAQGAEHAGTRVTLQKTGRAKSPPSAMRYWVTMSAQSLRPAALRWLGGFGRVLPGKVVSRPSRWRSCWSRSAQLCLPGWPPLVAAA